MKVCKTRQDVPPAVPGTRFIWKNKEWVLVDGSEDLSRYWGKYTNIWALYRKSDTGATWIHYDFLDDSPVMGGVVGQMREDTEPGVYLGYIPIEYVDPPHNELGEVAP